MTPPARREAVRLAGEIGGLSERRACRLVGTSRAMVRYRSRRPSDAPLRAQLEQFATERRRGGYRRPAILVWRSGTEANLKRIYRVYTAAKLTVRHRKKKLRAGVRPPQPACVPTHRNEWWSMDFLRVSLEPPRVFRVL